MMLAACSHASPQGTPKRLNDCGNLLNDSRTAILAAERIRLSRPEDAYRRFAVLDTLHDVTLGLRGNAKSGFLEIVATLEAVCGRPMADRMTIYDQWAQLLRDRTVDAVLTKRPSCRKWLVSAIRYDIALNMDAVSNLTTRFGIRDPDVRHIDALLNTWAKQEGIAIAPLADKAKSEDYLNSSAQTYDQASATSPADC
jgi:hypothetical protein